MKGVHFDNETDDHPAEPPAWGLAGWTKGDASVLLYDRFDIWELDPNGAKPAVVVTDSVGRKNNIQFRLAEGGGVAAVAVAAAGVVAGEPVATIAACSIRTRRSCCAP